MSNTIQHPLASAPFPSRPQRDNIPAVKPSTDVNLSSAQRIGFWFIVAFAFIVYGRVPELISLQLKLSFPLVMVISIFAALAALLALDLRRLAHMPAVLWLLAFTVWLMIAGLFSTWHGGTFQMFTDYWSKSILNCVVISILVVNIDQISKIMYAIAFATLVVIGAGLFWSGSVVGRMEIFAGSQSSLSNPNELASRLLSGLCFCLFLMSSERGFSIKKFVVGLSIPVLMVMALRTGSRSGLMTLGVLMLMLFVRASVNQKILMVTSVAAAFVLMLAVLPKDVLDRYAVTFSTPAIESKEALTDDQKLAVNSGEARKLLLEEGISLAFQHPLFGVGPGVYAAAAAGVAKEEGRRANWHETHNTFVQLAAENGFLGLIFYGAAIFYCLKKTFSLYRKTRNRRELQDLSRMSYYLLMAVVSWTLGALFDSQAYRLEFPLLAALTCSFVLAAEPKIKQVMALSVPRRVDAPGSPVQQFFSRPAANLPGPATTAPQPPATTSPVKSNPVRFGRMRKP